MALVLHLMIALSSVVCATYLFFRPSNRILHVSYALVIATVVTGTYLVLSTHSSLLSACATGLLYLSGISVSMVTAQYKLMTARSKSKNHRD